jgi:anti-anti-sigma factor
MGGYVARVLVIAGAYFGSAKLGLAEAYAQGNVTAVWPPTGIALAAVLIWGYRFWPGVALGALLANATTDVPALTTLGITVGNTLEAVCGAALLTRFDFRPALGRVRDVLLLFGCAAVVSTMVAATIGNLSLLAGGEIDADRFGFFWRLWWLGDMSGDLLVAPVLLVIATRAAWPKLTRARAIEAATLAAGVAGLSALALRPSTPLAFLAFPGLVVAALRFRQIGAAVSSLIVATIAVWVTARGHGPFAGGAGDENLLESQLFCAVGAMTALLLAAVLTERKRAEDAYRGVAETLQRSLLPDRLPDVPGVGFAARYLPGGADVEVGGDWYDAIQSPNGTVNLVIGDVAGRGVRAAATMGQLRAAARAYTLEGSSPATILEMVNRLAGAAGLRDMATALCIAYEPTTGRLRIANAGHLPPMVVSPGGGVRRLEVRGALPLNVEAHTRYPETEDRLEPGETLLLYTDGLVERTHETLAEGLRDLERAAAEAPAGVGPLCDHIANHVLRDANRSDDVALIAFQALPADSAPLHLCVPAIPEAVGDVRRSLRRWLGQAGATDEETHAVLVASGEACANSIEHAYGPGDAELEVVARLDAEVARLTVRDFGRWRPARGEHRGRGLELMHATMDEVAVTNDDAGTIVEMSLRLENAASAPEGRSAAAAPAPAPGPPAQAASEPAAAVVGEAGLRVTHEDDIVIAALDGEIDMANARNVFGEITLALDNRARGLVLDLSATRYLDSAGLQAMLELAGRTRRRGQELRVVAPLDSAPRRVLELVRAQDTMHMHTALPDALAGFPVAPSP